MNRSVIIIISVLWVLCTGYLGLAKANNYPYAMHAMIGSWLMSILLLVAVISFIKKHRG